MQNHKLVLPEHLNHFGFLFGGYLLKWVDEVAWIAASLEFPGYQFVTVGMETVEFHKSVREGAILIFQVNRIRTGNTSVNYGVTVRISDQEGFNEPVFSTNVTFVRVDGNGAKLSIEN
jgi:acyl-CoA hydrolase